MDMGTSNQASCDYEDFGPQNLPNRQQCRELISKASGSYENLCSWNNLRNRIHLSQIDEIEPWGPDLSDDQDPWECGMLKLCLAGEDEYHIGINLSYSILDHADLEASDLRHSILTFADLQAAVLDESNLSNACVEGANFTWAYMEDVSMDECRADATSFENALMERLSMQNAIATHCNFSFAKLKGSDFSNSNLESSDFHHSSLDFVNFSGTSLRHCVLGHKSHAPLKNIILYTISSAKACLIRKGGWSSFKTFMIKMPSECWHLSAIAKSTVLSNSDISKVKYFLPNGQLSNGVKFSPKSSDPYSVVRDQYTGPVLLFHLLFVCVFFGPYAIKAAMLTAAERLQRSGFLVDLADSTSMVDVESQKIIAILLGFRPGLTGLLAGFLSIVFLAYNTSRLVLTWWMGRVRDAEERSGRLPETGEYWWCFIVHYYFMRWVYVLAIVSFVYHAIFWSMQSITFPAAFAQ